MFGLQCMLDCKTYTVNWTFWIRAACDCVASHLQSHADAEISYNSDFSPTPLILTTSGQILTAFPSMTLREAAPENDILVLSA